jgi:hypothetical protein
MSNCPTYYPVLYEDELTGNQENIGELPDKSKNYQAVTQISLIGGGLGNPGNG